MTERDDRDGSGAAPRSERWVVVASLPFRGHAAAVASVLEGSEIPTRVVGDDAGGVLTGIGVMTGGVHVEVPERHAEEARELLDGLPADEEDLAAWRDGAEDGADSGDPLARDITGGDTRDATSDATRDDTRDDTGDLADTGERRRGSDEHGRRSDEALAAAARDDSVDPAHVPQLRPSTGRGVLIGVLIVLLVLGFVVAVTDVTWPGVP